MTAEEVIEDPSRELAPKKEGPYHITKEHGDTVTVDVKGLLNAISINRIILESGVQRRSEATT